MLSRRTSPAILFLIALVSLTVLVACQPAVIESSLSTDRPQSEEATFGLFFSTLYNPLFVSIQHGAIEAAGRSDVRLIVRDAQNEVEKQISQINELIDLGVEALIIHPVNGAAIVPAIEALSASGIPVFSMDRAIDSSVVITHIASDNRVGGEMAGQYLAETLQHRGAVVELAGSTGTSAATDRGAGFRAAIAEYQEMQIVSSTVADFKRRSGKKVFAEIIAEHPDVRGVFAHNDEMILGAIEAATDAGLAAEIVFVGFDATDDAVDALEEGTLNATIAQQPVEMGRLAIETAVKYLDGEEVPQLITVDLALITR